MLYAGEDKTLRGVVNFLSYPASLFELNAAVSFLGLYRDPTVAEITSRCDWRIAGLISAEQQRRRLQDVIDAYNFGGRPKTPKGLAPYGFTCKQWTSEQDRFIVDPIHQMPGLNT